MSALRQPRVVVHVPVEGRAYAYVECDSLEDERRLAFDIAMRDVLAEIDGALTMLLDALIDRREERL